MSDPADPADPFDPFDTAGIRRRVLDAWAASPARFREDANAEEELALGAYRDRLLVELAQNAADAALRAGVPGVLRLSLTDDGVLLAANTGAPLDAAGVQALATLRASAKSGGAARPADGTPPGAATVGRFGVGFAAVLAVTDEPEVLSRTGGVRFSAATTRAEVDRLPSLAAERARRRGAVPVLRLPWPAPGAPPAGFDTLVRLPLRGDTADTVRAVRAALAAFPADLLLGLTGLTRVEIGDRILSRVDEDGHVLLRDGAAVRRWRTASAAGTLPAELLADRPTEERERDSWSLTWAVPVDDAGEPAPLPPAQVVHAPTPSEEPLSLPVRLVATFPLDSGRRHVAPGPLTEHLVGRAARTYADLVRALPATPAGLALVPRVGLAAAALDAALARAVLAELRTAEWLPGEDGRVAPAAAVVVDAAGPELVAALGEVVAGLLPAEWSGRGAARALDAVDVRRLSTRDVVELVSSVDRPPSWWRRLYEGLTAAPDRDALGALPVPLADGRVVTGPRGLLLSDVALPGEATSALGLRLVHPDAVHPLLERLGATPAAPRALLADDRVRAAVEESFDADDPGAVADAVLALAAAADVRPGELPWLAELALPGHDGEWYPAGELLLPGGPLAGVIAADSPFGVVHEGLLRQWGAGVLEAAGVLRTFAVLRTPEADVGLAELDLDGEEEWYDDLLDRLPDSPVPPRLTDVVAVRDLELVDPAKWPDALALLAAPELRPAVEASPVAVLPDGRGVAVPPYTRWWLAHHRVLDGRRPVDLRMPDAVDLDGLYDPAGGAPADVLALAGCLTGLDAVLSDPDLAVELSHRLGDPGRRVSAVVLRDVYGRLARALDGYGPPPPARVRVAPDLTVPRADAVVLDAPHLLPLLGDRAVVPAGGAAYRVAGFLDVDLASRVTGGTPPVVSTPTEVTAWARVPGAALAAARCGAAVPDARVCLHTDLRVRGTGGQEASVRWWPDGGDDHVRESGAAEATAAALGRALSWRLGRWDRRAAAAEAFAAALADRPGGPLAAEDTAEDTAEDAEDAVGAGGWCGGQ